MPDPLGEAVTTTTTMDANLNHCLATGKSLTGCLHFVNKTPVDWYSKKQATVETATYGSEFVAAKTATEQIMDIRQTLRYLGAPITTKSFLFGDNRSVVTSATLPHSTLTKRHNILAFHRVREAIAAKLMAFYWIQSAYNLSDMLSKHWDHPTVYPMILMCDDVMCASHDVRTQASSPPYVYLAHQELLMDVPFAQAERYLSKLTASHFSTLNMDFANQNVLKRTLIAMLNKNKAVCNENFRICAEDPVAPLYKW